LPSSYTVDYNKSGGSAECSINGVKYTKSSQLPGGNNLPLECTVTTGVGQTASVTKNINVIKRDIKEVDSILSGLKDNTLTTGYYVFRVNNGTEVYDYPIHLYVLDGDQNWTSNQSFGDVNDIATANTYAQYMVAVKVNGNATIASGVTLTAYGNSYGGPKGLTLYVTGTLTNNGTITMTARGAKALGQNVYLWKNTDGTYEYVPATGASGGAGVKGTYFGVNGISGNNGTGRSTGGGGSGGYISFGNGSYSGAGGTSYSGGTGSSGFNSTYETSYTAPDPNGGMGGSVYGYEVAGGGAGNPNGTGGTATANGTGGLLTIYAGTYVNNGAVSSEGMMGAYAINKVYNSVCGGSSGGGTINIFIDNNIVIDKLGVITVDMYGKIKGTTSSAGGQRVVSMEYNNANYYNADGGAGGSGTTNIGKIINGKYTDLSTAIDDVKEAYAKSIEFTGDSILSIIKNNNFNSGYYKFIANGESYNTHTYVYDGNQTWSNMTFGDVNDVATASTYASNMVVVKVNGDLTINSGSTITAFNNNYGGPKGLTLYVTGTLTNNGTITMTARGAKALGQNVYLWKNTDGTYEYVPATGASGGAGVKGTYFGVNGISGNNGTGRSTGGGGSGGYISFGNGSYSGAGGTSYSGGTGSSGFNSTYETSYTAPDPNGGMGGSVYGYEVAGGGAGNPNGTGGTATANGTGGLLTIYAGTYVNNGAVSSEGMMGAYAINKVYNSVCGGSSGGGTINIFIDNNIVIDKLGVITVDMYGKIKGTTSSAGGQRVVSMEYNNANYYNADGGAGGSGTTNIGKIINGKYTDLSTAIDDAKEAFAGN
jgi:hypothetical protein